MSEPVVYSEAEVRRWLQWLARNMQKHGQTIFMVEQLQPSWFDSRWQTLLYLLVSNTLRYGILIMLGMILAFAPSLVYYLFSGPLDDRILMFLSRAGFGALLAFGCVGPSLGIAQVLGAITKGRRVWSVVLGVAGVLVYFGVPIALDKFRIADSWTLPLTLPLLFPLSIVAVAVRRARRGIENYVQPVERITLSWRAFVAGGRWPTSFAGWSLAASILFVTCLLCFEIAGEKPGEVWNFAASVSILYLLYRFIKGFVKGCMNLVESQMVGTKTRPNQGIWLSWSSSLYLLRPAIAVLALGVVAVAFTRSGYFTFSSFLVVAGDQLILVSILMAAWYGGMDFLDHFVLRATLRLFGYAPLSYPAFLDYAATELGFLQKVGGGYMFMHRYLLEYFATADGPPAVAAVPAISSQT